jgi:hypothetical protein
MDNPMVDMRFTCMIEGCEGSLDMERKGSVQVGCTARDAVAPCSQCGRMHFVGLDGGNPVFNRPGYAQYLKGKGEDACLQFSELPMALAVISSPGESQEDGDDTYVVWSVGDQAYLSPEGTFDAENRDGANHWGTQGEAEGAAKVLGYETERHKPERVEEAEEG